MLREGQHPQTFVIPTRETYATRLPCQPKANAPTFSGYLPYLLSSAWNLLVPNQTMCSY